jgi:hypothetical protein
MRTEQDNINILADNNFHFEILNMPYVSYMSQTFELPGVQLGLAIRPTPVVDQRVPGDKIDFDNLNIEFLVDEDLRNYLEVWKWIMYLGAPRSTMQYKNLVEQKSPYTRESDISLNITSNKFNIKETITFYGCFPVALSGILFNSANTQIEHPTATASFAYTLYTFKSDDTFTA